MREFLLWSNCPNNCQFCWQKKLAKPEMILTEQEKLQAVAKAREEIDQLGFTDILIVGGEVYCPHSAEVNAALASLFQHIADRIKEGQTRQLYANTNMIYEDTTVLDSLLDAFEGIEDKLFLTTSYDIFGRFTDSVARNLFLNTLRKTTRKYPKFKVVANTIMTQQACQSIISGSFNLANFASQYGIATICLIPYIPIEKGDIMMPSWSTIVQTLLTVERKMPGYLSYYMRQLDWTQPRLLKEYHKDANAYVECSSSYLECGHNENYKRAMGDDSCFVCRLKEMTRMNQPLDDEKLRYFVNNGYRIVTVGDMCSSYIWTHFKQPDIVVFDGNFKPEQFADLTPMIRDSGTKRIVINNVGGLLSHANEDAVREVFRSFDGSPVAIQTTGEEDEVLFICTVCIPDNWVVISGDEKSDGMVYYTKAEI